MDMLHSLQAFTRVVEFSGFAAAAREMGLSRSVVNKQVINLERVLGAQLLIRSTRRVRPTDAGLAFYDRALEVLRTLEDAVLTVSELQTSPKGNLRVNAPMSFGVQHLAAPIAEFMAAHQELHVELVLNDRQIDPIEEGFDLTIRIGEPQNLTSLVSVEIARTRLVLCASPSYLRANGTPESPAELMHHRCLHYGYQASGNLWRLKGTNGERGWRVNCVLWSNNGDVLRTAALADQGIALLPTFIVGAALQAGELVTVLPDHKAAPISVCALYPRHRQVSVKVQLLLALLQKRFGRRPVWDLIE